MKRIILFLALTAALFTVRAQVITEFPYFQGFENGLEGWTILSNDTLSDDDFVIDYSSWNARSGNYYVKINNVIAGFDPETYLNIYYTPDEALISPRFVVNDYFDVFEFYSMNYGHLDVYVLDSFTTYSDLDEDHLVATFDSWGWEYMLNTLPLYPFVGDTVCVAIRFHETASSYSSDGIFIDDIQIRNLRVPIITLPDNIYAHLTDSNLLLTTTLIQGDTNGMEYTWTSAMNAYIDNFGGDSIFINYPTIGVDTIYVTATNPYGTCSDTMVINVVSNLGVNSFPYLAGFEADDDTLWTFINDRDNRWYLDTTMHSTGSRAIYVSNTGGATCTYTPTFYDASTWSYTPPYASFAIRAIDFPEGGDYVYSYDWLCDGNYYPSSYGNTYFDYMNVWIADDYNLQPGYPYELNYMYPPTGVWTPLTDGGLAGSTEWQNRTGVFHVESACRRYIVVMWCNTEQTPGSMAGAIDNFMIKPVTCPAPADITVTAVGTNYATIGWTASDVETGMRLSVNGGDFTTITTNPYTINGLTSATDYTITLRSLCGDWDSSLTATATFRTECEAISVYPYVMDFEGLPNDVTDSDIPCWTLGTISPYGYSSIEVTDNFGNNVLYYYGNANEYNPEYGTTTYAILPETATPLDELQLSFEIKAGNNPAMLAVGLIDPDMFQTMSTAAIDTVTTISYSLPLWEEFTVDFTGHEVAGKQVIIITHIDLSVPEFIMPRTTEFVMDNVSFYPTPTCAKPSKLQIAGAEETSLTLAWGSNGSGATNYDVAYRLSGSQDAWEHVLATDSSVTVTGLEAFTEYSFIVKAICTAGDTSFGRKGTFRTLCSTIEDLPYYEGFEDLDLGCWIALSGSDASSSDDWNISQWYNTYNGFGSVYSSPVVDGFTDATLISPTFRIPADSADYLALVWYMTNGSYGGDSEGEPLIVVVNNSGNPYDLSAYTDTIAVVDAKYNYTKNQAYLNAYAGQEINIAFIHRGNCYNAIYLDDIEIRESKEPNVIIEGSNKADVNFAETYTANLIEGAAQGITYTWTSVKQQAGEATFTTSGNTVSILYSAIGNDTIQLVATNDFGTDTTYATVTVRDINPVTIPYQTGFEDDNDNNGWIRTGDANNWYTGTAINNGGTHSLYVSADNGTSNSFQANGTSDSWNYAYRGIRIDTPGDYYVTYDWHYPAGSTYSYIRAFVAPPHHSFSGGHSDENVNYYGIEDPYMPIDNNHRLNNSDEWECISNVFHASEPGIYELVFAWYNTPYEADMSMAGAIDNIVIAPYSCVEPGAILISKVTDTTISVIWSAGADETLWQVTLNDEVAVTIDSNRYTFTGLEPYTNYMVRVRSVCGYGDTSFATVRKIRTECAAIEELPWTAGFEDYEPTSENTEIGCWKHLGGGLINIGNNATNGNYMVFDPHYSYYILDTVSSFMVLPRVTVPTWALEVKVSIAPSDDSAGRLAIGYLTNAESATSFVQLAEYNSTTGSFYDASGNPVFHTYSVSFADVPANAAPAIRRTVISSATENKWFVDSVTIKIIDGVNPYACAIPGNLHTVNVTEQVAIVDWNPGSTETMWEIKLNTESEPHVVTSHPYVFSGLVPSTEYSVTVRAICSDIAISQWTEPLTFSTTDGNEGISDALFNSFAMYPNPASSNVTIDLGDCGDCTVEMVDMNGRTCGRWTADGSLTIDLHNMARGTYFVRVTNDNVTAVRKLVVQ